jgi:tetratricopeptide (TPR) repeat protein
MRIIIIETMENCTFVCFNTSRFFVVVKTTSIILLFLLIRLPLIASGETEMLLGKLDQLLIGREVFVKQKLARIDSLTLLSGKLNRESDREKLFLLFVKLQEEYKSFRYDSAFRYVSELNRIAPGLHDYNRIAQAKTIMGFTLVSSGLFKEAIDTLRSINISRCSVELKREYYGVIARTFFDLADYDNDAHFALIYRRTGTQYLDSALLLTSDTAAGYWSLTGLRQMKSGNPQGAADAFNFLISRYPISNHQYAIATSSLGYLYTLLSRENEAIDMLIRAAMADINSSTRETVALRNLAVLLFNRGDIERAYRYIKIALEDATFYNARHRKVEIGAVLPIIEGERLRTVEQQKSMISQYAIVVSILSVLVLVFFLIIFFQLRKLNKVKNILQATNTSLQEINLRLSESNIIKEEYIGYFFNVNSEFIEKLEAYRKVISRKVTARQFDELTAIISPNDMKRERENLYVNFDKIFLKLFPNFIQEFNSFFGEEDQVQLKHGELLNTDLRIFALMRLGITDSEKIAKFLDYSVNTIYTYKARIKNKVLYDRDSFEERVMEIR